MLSNNNIIPIYVNSKDRVDIKKPSTDMTIQLSKSLRNISSINISDVIIPENELLINNNNSSLSGYIIANGETYFSINITNGNYDTTTLGQEVETQLQNNADFKEFGITWTVSYNTATRRYVIIATYSSGIYLASWGIKFNYSSLVDVLGIGDNGTTDKETTTTGAQLSINIQRSPSIQRSLYYNITSSALTNDINTSYLHSLAKGFDITSNNNTINTEIKFINGNSTAIPSVINPIISNSAGTGVYISEDALYLFALSYKEVVVYSRANIDIQWTESTRFTPTINYDYSSLNKIAVSTDLSTVAVGSYLADGKIGATWVFVKIGYTYKEYVKLVGTGYTSTPQQGMGISINNNGTLIAIGGDTDSLSKGSFWIWKLIGTIWTQILYIQGITGNVNLGTHLSFDSTGTVLAVSDHKYNSGRGRVYIYNTVDDWATYSSQILTEIGLAANSYYGFSISLSKDGKTLAVGAYGFSTNIGRVYIYETVNTPFDTKYTIIPSVYINTPQFGYSLMLNNNGKKLVVGGNRDDSYNGAIWKIDYPYVIQERTTYTTLDSSTIYFGSSVSISNSGVIVSGRPYAVNLRGDIITKDINQSPSLLIVESLISSTEQGRSVSISDDEKIVAVGGPTNGGYQGSIWIYTNNFSTQLNIPFVQVISSYPQFGYSISLSGNGTYLAALGPKSTTNNNINTGLWIYKTTNNWATANLIRTTTVNQHSLDIDMNYDGTVLVVGKQTEAAIYTTTNNWDTLPTPVIVANGINNASLAYNGVSMNSTGNIIAVGDQAFNGNIGQVRMFIKSGVSYNSAVVSGTNSVSLQGCSTALNGAGNVLVFGGTSFNGGVGAAWVATTSDNWLTYNIVKLDIKNNIGNAKIGVNVSINIAGNIIAVGGDLDNNTGNVWKCITTDNWATHVVGKLQSTNETGSRLGTGLANTDNYIIAGAPNYRVNYGQVVYWYSGGYRYNNYITQIPTKTYTLFELSNKLTELLQLSEDYYITASYDMVNKVNLVITNNCPEAYFKITTNMGYIEWNTPSHVLSVESDIIDMSINNNILKTVINAPVNGLVVDTSSSNIYRKYKPGFTLNETDTIDIQLRNERDVIVDLGDINWVMVIYVTIHF
jgi:hypothetical protein